MTNEQEQLITLLFIKHGGFEAVLDLWLFHDTALSTIELEAVGAWMATDQTRPHNLQLVKDSQYPYLTADFTIDIDE